MTWPASPRTITPAQEPPSGSSTASRDADERASGAHPGPLARAAQISLAGARLRPAAAGGGRRGVAGGRGDADGGGGPEGSQDRDRVRRADRVRRGASPQPAG